MSRVNRRIDIRTSPASPNHLDSSAATTPSQIQERGQDARACWRIDATARRDSFDSLQSGSARTRTSRALRGVRNEVVGNPFEIGGYLLGPPKLHQRPD